MPTVSIRLLRDPSNFLQCEQIQKEVWGTVSLSAEALRVVGDFGGMVLGCFEGGRLLGFISALLARRPGELIHWSFQMAVRKRHRDRGLGFRMKLAHRRLALKKGIRSICWSYDPLQSRNAALNIRRLRALPEEYAEDYYGQFPSLIERGVPSDRFLVRWKIASPVVERHLRKGTSGGSETLFASSQVVNVTERLTNGFLTNREKLWGSVAADPDWRKAVDELEAGHGPPFYRADGWLLHAGHRLFARVLRLYQDHAGASMSCESMSPPPKNSFGRSMSGLPVLRFPFFIAAASTRFSMPKQRSVPTCRTSPT